MDFIHLILLCIKIPPGYLSYIYLKYFDLKLPYFLQKERILNTIQFHQPHQQQQSIEFAKDIIVNMPNFQNIYH